jgi:hypothetical protein
MALKCFRSRVGDGVSNSILEPSKSSLELYVSKMEIERVRAAIQELPVQFREIIVLREYEELSHQEIASVLNCPVGTVMSHLARARKTLRTLLSESQSGPSDPEETHAAFFYSPVRNRRKSQQAPCSRGPLDKAALGGEDIDIAKAWAVGVVRLTLLVESIGVRRYRGDHDRSSEWGHFSPDSGANLEPRLPMPS